MENNSKTRTFAEIAREIQKLWPNMYFGAEPYVQAMSCIHSSDKHASYLFEDAESIVNYFLANAQTWRGADARRIKAELKSMLK
jgi:hypothetical protein